MDSMSVKANPHRDAAVAVPREVAVDPRYRSSRASSVLHVIQPGEVGGAETVVRVLASAQRSRGARVAVAAIVHAADAATSFLDALSEDSIETHRVQVPARGYSRERREIAAICHALSPSVVHSHGYRADIVDALYMRRSVSIVSTVHGYTGGDARNRCYEWLQRRAFRRFDAVVAVSAPLARELEQTIQLKRLHVLPNAIQPLPDALGRAAARAALGLPADRFIVGWVGRMSWEKGADVLLDALAEVNAPATTHVAFVGDGPELVSLQRRATQLALNSRVSWLGRIANASRFFAAFDALVLSSRTEGTPMVVLEAMAASVPIVATRVGGVPDILTPGTALLVSPEAPMELAGAIRAVHADPDAALAIARAARGRLEARFSVADWAAAYENIYTGAQKEAARRFR